MEWREIAKEAKNDTLFSRRIALPFVIFLVASDSTDLVFRVLEKPLDNLPISVELSSTSNALSLSFPSPHTRPSQAFPITVTFTAQYHSTHAQATESVTKLPLLSIHLGRLSTEASMHDNLTAEKDRESRLEARITSSKGIEQLSKVFETSRDLSLVMRLILKKLLIV